MASEDIYLEAAEKLGYPGSASCVKFLRVLFTPEEGRLLLEFLEPATCEQVAKRLNMDEKEQNTKAVKTVMEKIKKKHKATLNRDVVYASAYMHETGHTLGFWPIGGHDENSYYFYQLGWWKWRPYKSCMNYGYMYYSVDYSDGCRGRNDFDDWNRLDLTYFQRTFE